MKRNDRHYGPDRREPHGSGLENMPGNRIESEPSSEPSRGRRLPALTTTLKGGRATMVAMVSVVIAVALLLGGTSAWFRSSNSVTNKFGTPQYQFDVPAVDEFTPPSVPLEPGDQTAKKVGAINRGDLPGFVRLLILPTVVAADKATVLPARIGNEIKIKLNTTDWADGGDGYYYYLSKLPAGQSTPDLFSEVGLASGLDGQYKGATLTVEVKCEAVDTRQWNYRIGWWGSDAAPTDTARLAVDTALNGLATP
jgi:predicted ribosomally synthesized peptide with SipW-like signal peptide